MDYEDFSIGLLDVPTPPKSEPFDDLEFPVLPDISPSPHDLFTPDSEISCFMDSIPTPSPESASMTPSMSMSSVASSLSPPSMSPSTPDKKSNRKRKVDQFPTPPSATPATAGAATTTAAATATTTTATSTTPTASTAAAEKKPPKKRKSWGQELPIPTTNLPPRKRAKTEPEKEQRRVERVLRNRQAAQASRERKRQEYLAMEQKAAELESNNEVLKQENSELSKRLNDMETRYKELERRMESMEKGTMASLEPPVDFINDLMQLQNVVIPQLTPPEDCTFDFSSPTQSPGLKPSSTTDPSLSLGPLHDEHPSSHAGQALSMTHQSAELMCASEDLQCLQRASTSLLSERFPALWTIHCILFQILTSILYSIRQPLLPLFTILRDGKAIPETLIPRFSLTNWKLMTKSTESILSHVRACSPALARLLSATSCAMRLELDKIDFCSSSHELPVPMEHIRGDQMEVGYEAFNNGMDSGIYGCNLDYSPGDSFFEEFTWLSENNGKAS